MVDERWVAKVRRTNEEKHELEGDPSYIWDQLGFWLSETAVHEITLSRVK